MFDLPDGSMNDICWTCQGVIDNPDDCVSREYQHGAITELPFHEEITAPKQLND